MSDRAFPADVVQCSFNIESSARDLGGESARTMGIVAPRGTTTRVFSGKIRRDEDDDPETTA